VARIGGDEFVVVLPGGEQQVAEKAIQRVRDVLEQSVSTIGGMGLSLSFGTATTDDPEQLEEILKLADERMYLDKIGKSSRKSRTAFSDRRLP
jgi:diguanylate cyclase (GGDEF)-like protein